MSNISKALIGFIIFWIVVPLAIRLYEKIVYDSLIPGNPPLKAKITQMSSGGYKWVVGHRYGFAGTYKSAVIQAKRQADKDRLNYRYREDARNIEV